HGGAEAARARRLVAVGREALAAREARADRDVAVVALHALEQAAELGNRVLAVRVDAPAPAVALLGRIGVPRGDPGRPPAVRLERDHHGPVLARDVRGAVGRAV